MERGGQRRIDLSLMVRLYNHQVLTVGQNQILNTYMLEESPERRFFGRNIDADANEILHVMIGA